MEKMADQFKIRNINSTRKTHFIKLNNIFSIFIFIVLISFSVSICSQTHHFTDSNDRHYIFLLCNGILFFLFMNFDLTHGSSLKQNQPVITGEIYHPPPPPPVLVSSAMEPVAAMEEIIKEIIEEEDDEMELNGNRVYVNEDENAVSIIQDRIEDEMAELQQLGVGVVEEEETGESKEAAETEELNKRCAEFIRNTRERMKYESSYHYVSLQSTKINATFSF